MAAASISLTRALGSAIAFIPKGIVGAFIPLIVFPAVTVAAQFLPDLQPPSTENLGAWLGGGFLMWLVLTVATVMQEGALYRLALGRKGVGPLGLQFNEVELRIIGSSILMGLLLFVLLIPAAIVVFVVGQNLPNFAVGFGRPAQIADLVRSGNVGAMAALCACGLWYLFLIARLRLFLAATVAENQIAVTSAWSLTSSSTLAMMLGTVLVSLPTWGVSLAGAFWQLDGEAVQSVTGLHVSDDLLNGLVDTILLYVIQPVLSVGFSAAAYRQATAARARRDPLQDPSPEPQSAPA